MNFYLIVFGLSFGILFCGCSQSSNQKRPNMLFIVADDIGGNDLGCYGNENIKTPNIDSLAYGGIKFTNVFLTTSSCSPSRSSILSGRYPHNTGAAELHSPLPSHLVFFPQLLRESGYYTGVVGKWEWVGDVVTQKTFDTVLTGKKAGMGGESQWVEAIRNRPKDSPLFLWLAAHDPHRPFREANNFNKFPNPQTKVTISPTLVDTEETRQDLMDYYNAIGRLDYYVGQVIKELKRERILQNTVIVFISDNGRPFPGGKTQINDRGVKTPFIIHWPDRIKGNVTCNSLISSIDIAPTLLELAGIKPIEKFQGVSFARHLLENIDSEFRNYVFAEHNWHDYEAYERMVRTKDFLYKINLRPTFPAVGSKDLVLSPSFKALKQKYDAGQLAGYQEDMFSSPQPLEEFYACRKDPLQIRNLINDETYQDEINRHRKILEKWQQETRDTEPDSLTPDWYDRMSGEPLPTRGKRGEMPGMAKRADTINKKGPF